MVGEAPSGHDGTAAGNDAGDAVGGHRYIAQQHAGMDREVVHTLFCLLDDGVPVQLPGQVIGVAFHLLQSLVDGNGPNGHGRVAENPFPGGVNVISGGKVHHGVRAPPSGPDHLLHFLVDRRTYCGVADVGVDLDLEVPSDDHRLGLGVVNVRGDYRPAPGNLGADEFRVHPFSEGDELHFRCDRSLPCIVHLGHVAAKLGAQRLAKQSGEWLASPLTVMTGAVLGVLFHVSALENPRRPERGKTLPQVQPGRVVGIGAAGVVKF